MLGINACKHFAGSTQMFLNLKSTKQHQVAVYRSYSTSGYSKGLHGKGHLLPVHSLSQVNMFCIR